MITASDLSINLQAGRLNNQGIIDCWNINKFCVVDFSVKRNRRLNYSLNNFYHDISEIKEATIFW